MGGYPATRYGAHVVNMARAALFLVISSIFWGTYSTADHAHIETLELVTVVYRHGDRTPIHMIPNDIHNETTWPIGLGQLTVRGIAQEQELGRYLRQQYDGYLSSQYNRKELFVHSTNVDRTLVSAQSVIASLYPTSAEERAITGLAHQLVPIHTENEETDPFHLDNYNNCSAFIEAKEEVAKLSDFQEFIDKYQDIFDLLSNKTGLQDLSIMNTQGIIDTMLIEKLYNKTWPPWMDEETFDRLYNGGMGLSYFYSFSVPPLGKYYGGPMLEIFIRNMQLRRDGLLNDPSYKMFMYSAHDTTVGALMGALQVFNNLSVPYSTMLMFELHKRQGEYFVEIYLRNDTKHDRYPLAIPGCAASCPLEDFLNLTSSLIPDSYDDLCGPVFSWLPFKSLPMVIAVTMAISIALLLVILTLGVCCLRRCKRRPIRTRNYGKIRVDMRQEEMPMMLSGTGSDLED